MSPLKKRITKLVAGIESNYDDLALALRKRLDSDAPVQVVTYRSYGNTNRLYVKGRVLKDKGIRKSSEKDTVWNNLLNMYKRFESDEIPHARLKINFEGKEHIVTADAEGYFTLDLFTDIPLASEDM